MFKNHDDIDRFKGIDKCKKKSCACNNYCQSYVFKDLVYIYENFHEIQMVIYAEFYKEEGVVYNHQKMKLEKTRNVFCNKSGKAWTSNNMAWHHS